MAQQWTDDVYAGNHAAATDLQHIENNFAALKSLFSGAAEPSNRVAGMPWFDTAQKVLKIRNNGDSAWYGLMHGDGEQKMWVYRNAALEGWAIDSGVTDKVLAVKGGTTYTAGGATAGTWQQTGHVLTIAEMPAHDHGGGACSTGGAHTHTMDMGVVGELGDGLQTKYQSGSTKNTNSAGSHSHTITVNSQGSDNAHNHGSTWRPAASVGTLQYLDL